MANNVYDTSGGDDSWDLSAPPAAAAPVAPASPAAQYTAQVPGGASDSVFSFGGDPNEPGMLGMSRGFWRDIARFSSNLGVAANARTAGGFLANGTGFAGPFAAATQETLAQGVKNAVTQSEINARNTQTMGEGLKNAGLASGLPLLQFQNQQNLDFAQNPEHDAAWQKRIADAYDAAFPPDPSSKNGRAATVPASVATGGGVPIASNPAVEGFVATSAQKYGIPPPLARALFQQESSMGTNKQAAGNIGQVTDSTARNPGYGMQPLTTPYQLYDPQTNVDYSLQYLRKVGDANGVTNWNDPSQWGRALRAYNGNGDPNYVASVGRYLPKGVQVADPGISGARPAAPAVAPGAVPSTAANPPPAKTSGNPPPAKTSSNSSPAPFVVGDSIAQGVRSVGGYPGRTYSGASPKAVLSTIQQTPDEEVAGKNVVLSGGASNDPSQVPLVAEQIQALKAKGAASVTLLGVGDSPKLASVNASLAAIAGATGARFTGALDPGSLSNDRVHPNNYKPLVSGLFSQATPAESVGPSTMVAGPGAPTDATPDYEDAGRAQSRATPVTAAPATTAPTTYAPTVQSSRQTTTGPEGPAAQKAAADAANAQSEADRLYNQAATLEQAQKRWEQMRAYFAARNKIYRVEWPKGDPALLRTEAAKAQQTAMDLGAAYPKTAAEGAGGAATHVTSDRPGSVLHDANGNVVASTRYKQPYTTPSGIPYTMLIDPVTDEPIISDAARGAPSDEDIPVGGIRTGQSPRESELQKQGVDLATGDINQDRKTVEDENEHVIGTAQSAKLQALQLKRLAPEAFTGPMGDVRAIGRAYLQYFTPKFADYFGANADVAQEFKKIALMQAGSQERATLGAKGSGYRATELYLQANPGLDMNEVANGHMANLLAVQQQASIDYGTGASGFYEKSRNDYSSGNGKAPYQRVTEYDNRYNQVFNDQTYAAAMGAMNDRPEAEWSKGLNPRQIQAVVGIVQRTDPTAKFEMGGAHGTADDFIKRGALTITPEDIITEKYSINGKLKPKVTQ